MVGSCVVGIMVISSKFLGGRGLTFCTAREVLGWMEIALLLKVVFCSVAIMTMMFLFCRSKIEKIVFLMSNFFSSAQNFFISHNHY